MLTKQLSDILQNLQSPGNFYSTGTLEIFPPRLEVNQVGRIALPLLSVQAEQLVKVADRAPYGKGYETLVDTEVRRTWQIDDSHPPLPTLPFKAEEFCPPEVFEKMESDVDYVTEKKSRPYSLVCTKNQTSYQRRVEQSQNDQEALAQLLAV